MKVSGDDLLVCGEPVSVDTSLLLFQTVFFYLPDKKHDNEFFFFKGHKEVKTLLFNVPQFEKGCFIACPNLAS